MLWRRKREIIQLAGHSVIIICNRSHLETFEESARPAFSLNIYIYIYIQFQVCDFIPCVAVCILAAAAVVESFFFGANFLHPCRQKRPVGHHTKEARVSPPSCLTDKQNPPSSRRRLFHRAGNTISSNLASLLPFIHVLLFGLKKPFLCPHSLG